MQATTTLSRPRVQAKLETVSGGRVASPAFKRPGRVSTVCRLESVPAVFCGVMRFPARRGRLVELWTLCEPIFGFRLLYGHLGDGALVPEKFPARSTVSAETLRNYGFVPCPCIA